MPQTYEVTTSARAFTVKGEVDKDNKLFIQIYLRFNVNSNVNLTSTSGKTQQTIERILASRIHTTYITCAKIN